MKITTGLIGSKRWIVLTILVVTVVIAFVAIPKKTNPLTLEECVYSLLEGLSEGNVQQIISLADPVWIDTGLYSLDPDTFNVGEFEKYLKEIFEQKKMTKGKYFVDDFAVEMLARQPDFRLRSEMDGSFIEECIAKNEKEASLLFGDAISFSYEERAVNGNEKGKKIAIVELDRTPLIVAIFKISPEPITLAKLWVVN